MKYGGWFGVTWGLLLLAGCDAGAGRPQDVDTIRSALAAAPAQAAAPTQAAAPSIAREAVRMSDDEVTAFFARGGGSRPMIPSADAAFAAIQSPAPGANMKDLIGTYFDAVAALPASQQGAARQRLFDHFSNSTTH